MSWLAVGDAAAQLGVSDRQLRALAESGALRAERLGGRWLIDADSVRARAGQHVRPGRPLAAESAWVLLSWLAQGDNVLRPLDRRMRHRLRSFVARHQDPDAWAGLLRRRADARPLWVHPGMLARLRADQRVSESGSAALLAHGMGLSGQGRPQTYVRADDVAEVIADFRAEDDVEGVVDLLVVPTEVSPDWMPHRGVPVPAVVAAVDLLDSPDAREAALARRIVRQAWPPKVDL